VKAREEGGSVSAGLISTLRETLDAIRGVASIISSFPICGGGVLGGGGAGDLRLASAVADCLDLLDLSSDELSWYMSTTSDDDYSPASAAREGAGGRLVGTGDARSDLRSWLSGALGNQDTCKQGLDEEGRVQGDGGGEKEEVEPDAGRRRHGRHGHLRAPQLRRRLHHLPQRHRR